MNKFWLVWNPASYRAPQVRHASEESAKTEAARLASQNVGQQFFVLESIGVQSIAPMWTPTPTRVATVDVDPNEFF